MRVSMSLLIPVRQKAKGGVRSREEEDGGVPVTEISGGIEIWRERERERE